jgi:hypothetical protein
MHNPDSIITMIRKIVARLKMKLRMAVKAIKAGFISAAYPQVPLPAAACLPFFGFVVPTVAENALNARLRYRKTSGHAPIFSLFSFFGDRQTS